MAAVASGTAPASGRATIGRSGAAPTRRCATGSPAPRSAPEAPLGPPAEEAPVSVSPWRTTTARSADVDPDSAVLCTAVLSGTPGPRTTGSPGVAARSASPPKPTARWTISAGSSGSPSPRTGTGSVRPTVGADSSATPAEVGAGSTEFVDEVGGAGAGSAVLGSAEPEDRCATGRSAPVGWTASGAPESAGVSKPAARCTIGGPEPVSGATAEVAESAVAPMSTARCTSGGGPEGAAAPESTARAPSTGPGSGAMAESPESTTRCTPSTGPLRGAEPESIARWTKGSAGLERAGSADRCTTEEIGSPSPNLLGRDVGGGRPGNADRWTTPPSTLADEVAGPPINGEVGGASADGEVGGASVDGEVGGASVDPATARGADARVGASSSVTATSSAAETELAASTTGPSATDVDPATSPTGPGPGSGDTERDTVTSAAPEPGAEPRAAVGAAAGSAIRDTTGPPDEARPGTLGTAFDPAKGGPNSTGDATSEIEPAGSAGPTACASGARNDGFCHDASCEEKPDTGLISGCGWMIRCRGGNIRQSARTTGRAASARRRKGHTAKSPPRTETGNQTRT